MGNTNSGFGIGEATGKASMKCNTATIRNEGLRRGSGEFSYKGVSYKRGCMLGLPVGSVVTLPLDLGVNSNLSMKLNFNFKIQT